MAADMLIEKIYMSCPLCGKMHDVGKMRRRTYTIIKDENVEYDETYYFCENSDKDENEFCNAAMLNQNLLNARNAYRVRHGLLTSDEIVAIRDEYGMSQVDLARMLGWGEVTISRYESKAIQDDAYDIMLRLVRDNPLQALELLNKNINSFTNEKALEIRNKILEKLDRTGKEFLTRKALEGEYAEFMLPSDANGYCVLNIDKLEAVISYYAKQVDNLYKVKLMKLLWYADVLAYRENGMSITGLVYRHDVMGALPIGHYRLMSLERLNIREEIGYNYLLMIRILPIEDMDYSVLNKDEIAQLDKVIEKFKTYKAKDIVDYMHKERAYKNTNSGEVISFSIAKDLREL